MLYQFLLDDVARKPPGSKPGGNEVDPAEGQSGQKTKKQSLFRTRSTPKRTHAFHFPLQSIKRETWEDEAVPESPTLPPPAAQLPSPRSMPGEGNRLTM